MQMPALQMPASISADVGSVRDKDGAAPTVTAESHQPRGRAT